MTYKKEDLLPTPTAMDSQKIRKSTQQKKGSKHSVNLKEAISMGTSDGFHSKKERSISLPEASRASLLVKQVKDGVQMTAVISGQKCYELLGKHNLAGSWVKTLLESSRWRSNKVTLVWKPKQIMKTKKKEATEQLGLFGTSSMTSSVAVTPSKHLLFQLVPSARHTGETGYGLLLTPTATNIEGGKNRYEKRTAYRKSIGRKYVPGNLAEQITTELLPTPRVADIEGAAVKNVEKTKTGFYRKNKKGVRFGVKVKDVIEGLAPTPTASDYKSRGPNSKQIGIDNAMKLILTPTGSGMDDTNDRALKKKQLHAVVSNALIPTPRARDWKGEGQKRTIETTADAAQGKAHNGTKTGLKLQPSFVEWMMGYPPGWTDLNCQKPGIE